jgi:integrase
MGRRAERNAQLADGQHEAPVVLDEPPALLPRTNCAYVRSTGFEDRRDTAIVRPFVDAWIRLAELTALTMDDADFDMRVAHVIEKGRRPRPCPFRAKTAKAVNVSPCSLPPPGGALPRLVASTKRRVHFL